MEAIMNKKTLLSVFRDGCKLSAVLAAAAIALVAPATVSAQAAWAHQGGALTPNGAIVIKSLAGGSYSGTRNPAGAVAKGNQTAATQPATVIVQATASLPIKNVGDACTVATSGTAPNQTATEGTAITSDRSALLSCQSGVWKKGASGAGTLLELTCNYMNNGGSCTPPSCPSGWTDLYGGAASVRPGSPASSGYTWTTNVRQCFNSTSYSVLQPSCYFMNNGGSCTPSSCPAGWMDLAVIYDEAYSSEVNMWYAYLRRTRACVK